jgi:hypothetical protein
MKSIRTFSGSAIFDLLQLPNAEYNSVEFGRTQWKWRWLETFDTKEKLHFIGILQNREAISQTATVLPKIPRTPTSLATLKTRAAEKEPSRRGPH